MPGHSAPQIFSPPLLSPLEEPNSQPGHSHVTRTCGGLCPIASKDKGLSVHSLWGPESPPHMVLESRPCLNRAMEGVCTPLRTWQSPRESFGQRTQLCLQASFPTTVSQSELLLQVLSA